jgi:lysophospholipase L1-like esterase
MHKRLAVLALVLLTAAPAWAQAKKTQDHWITTWATAVVARAQPGAGRGAGPAAPAANAPAAPAVAAPAGPPQAGGPAPGAPPAAGRAGGGPGGGGRGGFPAPLTLNNQTLRQIVHVSAGGSKVRVVLSNAFGSAPIDIGAAHVALRAADANVQPQSVKPLTVNGATAFSILAGAVIVTDAAELNVPAGADLAIDLFFPGEVGNGPSLLTVHQGANQTNYVLAPGNSNGVATPTVASRTGSWTLLSRVEVTAPAKAGTVVTFGDSITDGTRSTTDTNSRWPDVLARRLAMQKNLQGIAVANEGIAGNRLLGDGAGVSALARFDRDVLLQTGAAYVIVLEGINDIGVARANATPTAQDLITAHEQMIERAHAMGLKIYGATLTPFEGAAYATPEGEAKRTALNEWIRTSGKYDGVIDFDKAARDPMAPAKFNPLYDSGDHLHPNDAGYKAMGEAIDLSLFK